MNDKQKVYMQKQQTKLYNDLSTTFNLPVFEDEIAEDEALSKANYFLIVYGDMVAGKAEAHASQEVYVVYVSEENAEVETTTLDILSIVSKVSGYNFKRTVKERLQKGETDEYVDQVTIIFRRMLKYECQI